MQCIDCCYCWREEWEDYPHCHWEVRCPGDIPPCEEEDDYYDELNNYEEEWYDDYEGNCDEVGYDPYLGCYSDDC